MTTKELTIQKLEFVKEFLNEEDENIVKEQLAFFWNTKKAINSIPGVPSTIEELNASVKQGMADYRNGRVISEEELEKEIALW
jgi:hypothetical protein